MAPGAHLHLSGQQKSGKETEEQKPEVELQGLPAWGREVPRGYSLVLEEIQGR